MVLQWINKFYSIHQIGTGTGSMSAMLPKSDYNVR
jgi:hypothetical protein